jgi:hypothetical protein
MKTKHQFKQSDLLYVTLLSAGNNKYIKTTCKGWLLITEVAIDGRVIQANFCPEGGSGGYGATIWPKFRVHILVRGTHGECSPFAAMNHLKLKARVDRTMARK